jgi:hypothetical protein
VKWICILSAGMLVFGWGSWKLKMSSPAIASQYVLPSLFLDKAE